jgi:hypothetical protein
MRTVLLVEPAAEIADPLASELRAGMFMVELARSARAALQVVGEQRPDAVVIALDLPDGPLEANAFVVRRVGPEAGLQPGVGLQFFAMGSDARDRWDRFVGALSGAHDVRYRPEWNRGKHDLFDNPPEKPSHSL